MRNEEKEEREQQNMAGIRHVQGSLVKGKVAIAVDMGK